MSLAFLGWTITEQPFAGGLPAVISAKQLAVFRRSSFRAVDRLRSFSELRSPQDGNVTRRH
jgi:hypothetical protein